MSKRSLQRLVLPFLAAACLALAGTLAAARSDGGALYEVLAPEAEHRDTSIEVVKRLVERHYSRSELDDRMSSRIFDRYLANLDPNRSYFLASDIAEFEPYRERFDDLLQAGNLEVAYRIYNRYQQRLAERLGFMLARLDAGLDTLDFTRDETLDLERKDAAWITTREELDDLWRRRLKNAALNLRLADKEPDSAVETLRKRYASQLNRLRQGRSEDAFQTYINALAYNFDPHTAYLSPNRSEDFSIDMNLQLQGIGAALQLEDEYTKVVRIIPGGPAHQSNQLHPADRIVAVAQGEDGEMVDVIGWRLDEVVRLIRGPKGTVVRLEVIPARAPDGQGTRVIKLRRDTVRLEDQAASSRVLEFNHEGREFRIGVIRIPTFYVNLSADVHKLLDELKQVPADGVLVDLRNNGGGSLEEANLLTGLFIGYGPTVQIRNARGHVSQMRDTDNELAYAGPLAVLVNRSSASASEIFAGAMQDYGRGLILGSRTFGKGTVQTLRSLDHGRLKLTMAKFYRISGESTQHQGIVPDISYPELIDVDLIGESALDGALPWDKIAPLSYPRYNDFSPLLDTLRKRHLARAAHDIEFTILNERIARQKELQRNPSVSLNEPLRRSERASAQHFELKLENQRRRAKGLALLDALPDGEDEVQDPVHQRQERDNQLVDESSRILADLILLSAPITTTTMR
jgi:carboxyl-terminal processing protease